MARSVFELGTFPPDRDTLTSNIRMNVEYIYIYIQLSTIANDNNRDLSRIKSQVRRDDQDYLDLFLIIYTVK